MPSTPANSSCSDSGSAAECCLDPGTTKQHIRIAASSICGRRAMVNKLWWRELVRSWFSAKWSGGSGPGEGPAAPAARSFSEPRSSGRVEPWFLCYRWLVVGLWLAIIGCSLFEVGSYKPLHRPELWPIYLTNWDLLMGLGQAALGAHLAQRRWSRERAEPEFHPDKSLALGRLERLYWFGHVATLSLALGVTATYWALVHDPRLHSVDPLNVMIHVCNSLLMLAELGLSRVPVRLSSFWWCPGLVSCYLLFSLGYYAAGGRDRRGQPCIYDVLDWARPGRTLLVCAGGLGFLVLTHCLLYFVARLRDRRYLARLAAHQPDDPLPHQASRRKNESCV